MTQIVRVSKFWREYAGHLAVEAIDDKVTREFIPWRRDYYASFKKLPTNAKLILARPLTSLRRIDDLFSGLVVVGDAFKLGDAVLRRRYDAGLTCRRVIEALA